MSELDRRAAAMARALQADGHRGGVELVSRPVGRPGRAALYFEGDRLLGVFAPGCGLRKLDATLAELSVSASLRWLDLAGNELEQLPAWSGLAGLETAWLDDNRIATLPEAVELPASLRRLDLDRNGVVRLPVSWEGSLETLNLYGNDLAEIPALEGLDRLKDLSLGRNRLSKFPDAALGFVELERLNLGENEIDSVPAGIGELERLRMLDLGHNRIESLPPELGRLQRLTDALYLADNRLRDLPAELGELRRLRYLNAGGNELEQLPERIGELRELRSLRLDGNALRDLPSTLGALSELRELFLDGNRLKGIPDGLASLPRLVELRLRGNPLVGLPEALGSQPALRSLDLRATGIGELPAGLVRGGGLERVDLRWVKLRDERDVTSIERGGVEVLR